MSDHYLRLIPTDPCFAPHAEALQAAERTLAALVPVADCVVSETFATVEFVDCGGNLESVGCPACQANLLDGRWQELMDRASQRRFAELSVALPCCGRVTSLNELHYNWPCGFAKVVLEARNPGRQVSEAEIESIAVILGCGVRAVWSHV